MNQQDLITRARDGLRGNRRPKDVALRRAVSDSYYAVFHALCQLSADNLVGVIHRNSEAWRRLYRGHEHGKLKIEFKNSAIRNIDPSFARIGAAFVQLQEARHIADYDPFTPYLRRSDVEIYLRTAEATLVEIGNLQSDLARRLATIMLIKNRG